MDKSKRPNQQAIRSPDNPSNPPNDWSNLISSNSFINTMHPPGSCEQAMEESAKTPSKVSASEDNKDQETRKGSKVGFSEDEETLIARMFGLVGERWDLIAGRIPGRSAEEIKKYYWTKHA